MLARHTENPKNDAVCCFSFIVVSFLSLTAIRPPPPQASSAGAWTPGGSSSPRRAPGCVALLHIPHRPGPCLGDAICHLSDRPACRPDGAGSNHLSARPHEVRAARRAPVCVALLDVLHRLAGDLADVVRRLADHPACRIDDPQAVEYTYGRQSRAPFNITGSPAISVPAGFSKAGLPLAIQIVGAPFSEALLYRVAHAYEQATTWSQKRPQLS